MGACRIVTVSDEMQALVACSTCCVIPSPLSQPRFATMRLLATRTAEPLLGPRGGW